MHSTDLDGTRYRQATGRASPQLFIVGAPRAGTTTLYDMLRRHPDVFMSPRKEPGFFHLHGQRARWRGPGDRRAVADLGTYARLFAGARPGQLVGEASTVYLYSEVAAERIARCVPEARVIAILREPAERAHSNFMQHVMQGRERLRDLRRAADLAGTRLAAGWSPFWDYLGMGMYGRQLQRYYDALPREAILVLRFEDLTADLDGVMRRVCAFLGLRQLPLGQVPGGLNASGLPQHTGCNALLQQARRGVQFLPRCLQTPAQTTLEGWIRRNLRRVPLDPSTRADLADLYHQDTQEASRLSGEDLLAWYRDPREAEAVSTC